MRRRHRVTGLVLLATIWFTPALAQTGRDAKLLLRNGHIITMDGAKRVVGARAVRDGRILALWVMATRSPAAPVPVPSCLTCTGTQFWPDLSSPQMNSRM